MSSISNKKRDLDSTSSTPTQKTKKQQTNLFSFFKNTSSKRKKIYYEIQIPFIYLCHYKINNFIFKKSFVFQQICILKNSKHSFK